MKAMGLNEIREKFLSFFESKGHLRLPSFSLVPHDDPSLLLINSGMAPLKKYFTGELTPPRRRVTTCQKCIRTPDIERVGKTARHATYFEMLGNFSFGDYFKLEAATWAWEFVTEVMGMPVDRLWVSIYEEDDEAFDIWTKQVGVAPDRVVRLGKADNFWEHGTGPCGPCSEIYFDRGPERGCGSPACAVGCDCDRYVEFWNLVFTQFDSDGKGGYARLENPNIDTGMGLERLACIMQGVDSLFEVDTVRSIMEHVSRLCGVKYGQDPALDVSLRVITDHIRSIVFMTGDGVIPANEGRGYVLRRLLRRAARHGKLLGLHRPFLHEICDTVIAENTEPYPELREKREVIRAVILAEEERFARTIDQGLSLLSEMAEALKKSGKKTLSGDDAFRLYDTYGFPPDLTRDVLEEQGLCMDEKGFAARMEEQRSRARAARAGSDATAWKNESQAGIGLEATEFVGYALHECEANVLALYRDGEELVAALDRTPFYAESGGQAADRGVIEGPHGVLEVVDCRKNDSGVFLHRCVVKSGKISEGETALCRIDTARRQAVMRNHSAAHLLQAALRRVLGAHVEQAGSYVDDERLRFDFTHFAALTKEQLERVQALVNDRILAGLPVEVRHMPLSKARAMGATALFGEKYGDVVRVVSMGDFSAELCGGTHLDNTAKAGLFYIVSESSIAAGVRRIEAVTGLGVLALVRERETIIDKAAQAIKASPSDLANRAEQLFEELKRTQRRLEAIEARAAGAQADALLSAAETVGGLRVIVKRLDGTAASQLRVIGDSLRDKAPDVVAVLAVSDGGKLHFTAVCGANVVKAGLHAGSLVRETAKAAGGGGGGRPDSASAGGGDPSRLNEALSKAMELIRAAVADGR